MSNPIISVRRTTIYKDPDAHWRTVWLWCPGCDSAKGIPIPAEDGSVQPDGPTWTWNGSLDVPTLSPSILQEESGAVPRCHSYVTNGQWQFLTDCTHQFAGQTVDMVPLPDWLCPGGDA